MKIMWYHVSYDLEEADGGDYDKLFEEIKIISNGYSKILLSSWVIYSESTGTQIRDRLKNIVNNKISIFVSKIDLDSSWYLPKEKNEFLTRNLKDL